MKGALAIILYDHPWEHTSDYASQTCRYLRKHNLVIGLLLKDAQSIKELIVQHQPIWYLKKVRTNYYLVKPMYIVPFRRFKTIVHINLILNAMVIRTCVSFLSFFRKIKRKYLWVYNPEHLPVVRLFIPSFFTIYDCVDYHGSYEYESTEGKLLQLCDKVFVNSHTLFEFHKNVRSDVSLVPLGFDLHGFSHGITRSGIRLQHHKPTIGYIGGINSRLDFPLLISVIKNNPQWNFVFVGPIQKRETEDIFIHTVKPRIDGLFRLPNAHHVGSVPKNMIPFFVRQFTVCIIPYDIRLGFNKYCYPMKLFEYFYMGKPVIATPITELKRFPKFIKTGESAIDWEKHIKALLLKSWPDRYKRNQRQLSINNSWDSKLSAISHLVDLKTDKN